MLLKPKKAKKKKKKKERKKEIQRGLQDRMVDFSFQDYISGIVQRFEASCEFHRSSENRVPVLIEKRGIVSFLSIR